MKTASHLSPATKVAFARQAKAHGLKLIGAPWNKTLEQVTALLDEQGERILETLGDERDDVTGDARHLVRHAPEKSSHLRLGAEDQVFQYGPNFWLVRGEYPDGQNKTVVYVS